MINVEVAYATEQYVELIELSVTEGTTVLEAITQSGMAELHPEAKIAEGFIGMYGKLCSPDTSVREGDRIEIYRPLLADPKEARRRRADRQNKPAG